MSFQDLLGGTKKETAAQQKVEFNGPCPFCGKMIKDSDVDPCGITVTTKEGKWQTWSCHAACFKEKMVSNDYLDISPAHF